MASKSSTAHARFTGARLGHTDGLYLPCFRLRRFGPRPCPQQASPCAMTRRYSKQRQTLQPDAALRYTHTIDVFDIGLSYFKGTARAPILAFGWRPMTVFQ